MAASCPAFETDAAPVHRDEFQFENWKIRSAKSHIMPSGCVNQKSAFKNSKDCCDFCRFSADLKLAQWPEMIFAKNSLEIFDEDSGARISFDALNALREVPLKSDENIQVATSEEWQGSRQDAETFKKISKPYDWTFTTEYKGTLEGFSISPTTSRIDLEKLKIQEKILFYEELNLYEDELSDNGCSDLQVKFRCMPSGWFALLRFYLRVDHVMVRVVDTRFRWEIGQKYLIREWTWREKKIVELNEKEAEFLMDANRIWPFLPIKKELIERLDFGVEKI